MAPDQAGFLPSSYDTRATHVSAVLANGTTGDCLSSFAVFLEEAKPAEIRLLGEMRAEWANWGGSLWAGNFFAAVAESVLHHDTETRLKA